MRAEWMIQRLPASGLALDVGFAGEHSEAVHLALQQRLPALRLMGVDLNVARVRELQLPRTLVGDAFALPFADGTFDAVIIGEVLEHLPVPDSVLSELRRVLQIGGSLIVTTPNAYELTRWWRHWLFASRPADARNVRGYLGNVDHKGFVEPLSFCEALRRQGLDPVSLETLKFHVPLVGRLLGRPLILRGRGFLLNRLGAYLCIEARRVA